MPTLTLVISGAPPEVVVVVVPVLELELHAATPTASATAASPTPRRRIDGTRIVLLKYIHLYYLLMTLPGTR
jgi:hypothetical protein